MMNDKVLLTDRTDLALYWCIYYYICLVFTNDAMQMLNYS